LEVGFHALRFTLHLGFCLIGDWIPGFAEDDDALRSRMTIVGDYNDLRTSLSWVFFQFFFMSRPRGAGRKPHKCWLIGMGFVALDREVCDLGPCNIRELPHQNAASQMAGLVSTQAGTIRDSRRTVRDAQSHEFPKTSRLV
jgi:hypothetical protein